MLVNSTTQRTNSDRDSDWPAILDWEWVLLGVALIAVLITRIPTLDQRLLEAHSFRQTQTAIQALYFHTDGIDLLRPIVPVLGAPWTIPFEFPLFQALASIPMSWGIGPDAAMRITGLGFFIASAATLWALLRAVAGSRVAAVGLVVFAFSPFAMLWSRSAMMEYLATFGALGWLFCAVRWRQTGDWRWAIPGALLGAIGATVKITTALAWAVPVVLLGARTRWRPWRTWLRARLQPPYLALISIPALASLAWTMHSDAVKRAADTTAWLTSSALRSWNLGTIDQRLDLDNSELLLDRIANLLVGRHWLVVVLIGVATLSRKRVFWVSMLLVPMFGLGAFFNLYVQHDYYLAAISPAAAALVAGALVGIGRWVTSTDRARNLLLASLATVWVVTSLYLARDYWRTAYDEFGVPSASTEIAALTSADEYSMVFAKHRFNWSPHIFYYADRRGMMLREPPLTVDLMARQPDLDRYRLLWTDDPTGPSVEYAGVGPWFAPVSDRSLALANGRTQLQGAGVIATTMTLDPGRATTLATDAVALTCDGADSLSTDSTSSEVLLLVDAEGEARPQPAPGLIGLPSSTRSIVWPAVAEPLSRSLVCHGGGSLEIVAAYEVE